MKSSPTPNYTINYKQIRWSTFLLNRNSLIADGNKHVVGVRLRSKRNAYWSFNLLHCGVSYDWSDLHVIWCTGDGWDLCWQPSRRWICHTCNALGAGCGDDLSVEGNLRRKKGDTVKDVEEEDDADSTTSRHVQEKRDKRNMLATVEARWQGDLSLHSQTYLSSLL